MNLTNDQYDVLYLAATNLLYAIHEGRDDSEYADHLAACAALLTGCYPEQAVMQDIAMMARASNRSRESTEAIIRRLIGDFTYDAEYWKKHSISMSEVEALGGII